VLRKFFFQRERKRLLLVLVERQAARPLRHLISKERVPVLVLFLLVVAVLPVALLLLALAA
jgi:hypothetical protein